MIKTSELVAGRIYTFEYEGEFQTVGFRKTDAGRKENPLAGQNVTVKRVFKLQAAGKKTYEAVMKKKNPSWTPSADYVAWWTPFYDAVQMAKPENQRNTCIVEHKKNATRYLRGIPRGVISEVFTIDNKPATPEQVETLKEFKKNSGGGDFILCELSNLNILDQTDASEEDADFDLTV